MIYARALEHNLCKNVFMGPAFLWQTQIQTIEYGLNDTIRITKNEVILMLYTFTPSDFNAQNDFDKNFARITLGFLINLKFMSEGLEE